MTEEVGIQSTLFAGLRFWLAQKVPQRSRFVNDIKANSGEIVLLDKQADVRIVDHARKEILPGTHSYTFIEKSIRNGGLEKLEDHIAGPPLGTIRNVGSTTQPAKGSRNKFTQDDDRFLWHWVQNTPQKYGGTDGNEIYKQLEAQNSRHPWQSWRDRWIKQLKGKPRPAFIPENAPLTPPSDHSLSQSTNSDQEAPRAPSEDMTNLRERNKSSLRNTPIVTSPQHREDFPPKEIDGQVPAQGYCKGTTRSRRPSFRPDPPMIGHNISPLPVRTSLNRHRTTTSDVSRSDPSRLELENKLHLVNDENTVVPPNIDFETSPLPPRNQRIPEEKSTLGSPKRKRSILDEDDLPSSAPPVSASPLFFHVKRQRRDEVRSIPLEIASTPENSPSRLKERPLARAAENDGNSITELVYENSSRNESSMHDSSVEVEGSSLGRQISPTLSSPRRAVHGLQTATTQATFEDPTQYIDLEVPPPDEGWDDDDIQEDNAYDRNVQKQIVPDDYDVQEEETHSENVDDGDADQINIKEEEVTLDDYADDASTDTLDPNTQLIDFDLPDTIPETQPTLPDTQGLLGGKTQIPDFGIAEPDGGWDDLGIIPSSPSQPPAQRTSPPAVATEEQEIPSDDDAMDVWIESKVALRYSIEDIGKALYATSTTNFDLADYALWYLTGKGKGSLPRSNPGIWTEADDQDLHSVDARSVERVHKKHGEAKCNYRMQFLGLYGPRKKE